MLYLSVVRYHILRAYRNRSMLLHVNNKTDTLVAEWDQKLYSGDSDTEKKLGLAEAKLHLVGMPPDYGYNST